MSSKEILIRNLFRELEKTRLRIIHNLIYNVNEYVLTSDKDKKRITLIIKIEDIT